MGSDWKALLAYLLAYSRSMSDGVRYFDKAFVKTSAAALLKIY